MSRIVPTAPSNQVQFQGRLKFPPKSVPLQVLVDSRADDDFICSELCSKSNLPTETLPEPKDVFALNEKVTCSCHSSYHSCHSSSQVTFKRSFEVIPSTTSLLVLGLPWLMLHKPYSDWSTASIANWSTFCHTHCLRSATPSRVPSPPVQPKPTDLSVLSVYYKLQEVFSKDRALTASTLSLRLFS